MSKSTPNPKIPLIIDAALAIITEEGDQGLTMRRVAGRANMSLSNLQYYFKNKNALLKGMVDHFFAQCLVEFERQIRAMERPDARAHIRALVAFGLDEEGRFKEICLIFRELWAIAARYEEVNAHVNAYYGRYAEGIDGILARYEGRVEVRRKVVSILMASFEGFAITAATAPLDRKRMTEALTDMAMMLMEAGG